MRCIVFSLFVLLLGATSATAQTESTNDPNRNSCSDYLKLKKEIGDIVRRINDDYARDKTFLAHFQKAQAEWESYREAQLNMIYPSADKSQYGQNYATCRCNWLVEFANARLNFLVKFVSNTNEDEVCGGVIGSTKRKSYVKFNK